MSDRLGDIEQWVVYACANCGADWGDPPASGVRQCGNCTSRNGGERIEVVRASIAKGAVDAVREAVDTIMPRDGSKVDGATIAAACERLWEAVVAPARGR